ncbi:hypothetical protein PV755_00630 [Streptomyces caniscabiei]|uniref:hypothetical protein n=1 Tax=Streptomyces caniscabiei TaxID=2746961 RepID=UPI0029B3DF0D|nr:hypothetical protein [Streptomyces caniscabiei]MDX3507439.1 hypothetical protein [Streptomyces caniscabiei]
MAEPTSADLRARLAAREVLTRRLVEQHGLTRFTARRAVIAVEEGRDTPHADLVRAEAAEVVRPLVEAFQQIREQLRPAVEAWAATWRAFAEHIRRVGFASQDDYALAPPQDRPAWQSPYGPAPRRR